MNMYICETLQGKKNKWLHFSKKKYLHVPVHKIADKNTENIVECMTEWKYESFKHVSTVSAKRLFSVDKIRIMEN